MISCLCSLLFVIITTFSPCSWWLPAIDAAVVRRWNTMSDTTGQYTVAASTIPRLIRWSGRFFVGRSLARDVDWYIEAAVTPLLFFWVSRWRFPDQYACAFPLVSLPLSYSSYCFSSDWREGINISPPTQTITSYSSSSFFVVSLLTPTPLLLMSGSSVHSPIRQGWGLTIEIDDNR